jgi:hypothetical protein
MGLPPPALPPPALPPPALPPALRPPGHDPGFMIAVIFWKLFRRSYRDHETGAGWCGVYPGIASGG